MVRLLRISSFLWFAVAAFSQQKNAAPAPIAEKWKISGVVVDANSGVPLAGVEVAMAPVTKRNDFRTVTTTEDGRFAFDNLSPGKYALTGQRKGYVLESFDQHAQYSTAIAVGPRLQSEDLLFRLHRDASISGTVTDEQNEPVRNAEITLLQESIFNGELVLRSRGTTNDEGVYHFGHLTPGKYFVAASSQPWYAQPYRIPTKMARTMTDGAVVGTRGTTDQQDASDEQPSNSPLDVAYPVTFYPGATEFEAASPIVLTFGARFTADLTLRAVPAIHLRITSPPTIQSVNTQVQAHLPGAVDMPVRSSSVQIEPGVTEVSGLAPGHYLLQMNLYDGKSWNNSSREVSVSGDTRISLDEKDGYVPLSGTLKLDPAGMVLSQRGQVFFRNKTSGRRFSATISSKGDFEIDHGVPAGRYEITVSVIDYFLKNVTATGGHVAGRILDVSTGTPVKLTLELGQGVGQVTGVALKDDAPMGGVMVVLVPQDPVANPQYFRRDQSDSDGTFTVASIIPGKYTVVAIENGWDLQWGNPKTWKSYMAQGTSVQVEPKGKYDIKVKIQSVYTQ